MNTPSTFFLAPILAVWALHPAFAQSPANASAPPAVHSDSAASRLFAFTTQPAVAPAPAYSTSLSDDSALPDSPATSAAVAAYQAREAVETTYHPFRSYAVALRIGVGGIGGEVATPILRRLNLRVGVEAFTYSTTFNTNGLSADGTLKLGETFATLDYHPFHNGFRLSPGLTLYNRNNVGATLNVPGGSTFTLNDVDYTSEASDPITGTAGATFGNKVAPRFTIGWGNSFPRFGGHWSFPVELGFYYVSTPTVSIALSGSACSSDGCGSIDTPDNEANIQGEQVKLNNDLAPARFFPVFSLGVGYRFGH
jgi:hypothetical protein